MFVIIAETPKHKVYLKNLNEERYENITDYVGYHFHNEAPDELAEKQIALIVNSNAMIEGARANDNLYPFFYLDIVVFCGVAPDGEYIGLTCDQQDFINSWLYNLSVEH